MFTCTGINDICNSQQSPKEADGRRCKRRNNTDWIWLQACLGEGSGVEWSGARGVE